MGEEKRYETRVVKWLESKGCYVRKYFANRNTKRGVPDLICVVNGYPVYIEVKASTGKPSELQYYNQRKIREAGGISIILYPDRFEEFKAFMEELLRMCPDPMSEGQYDFDKKK